MSSTTIRTGTYSIDPAHSRIGFVARHAMVTKVRGSCNEFEGSGSFDSEQSGDDEYRVTGDLTIKGVTKPVTVEFEYSGTAVDPHGNQRIGLDGKATVNRKDWGVSWNAALEASGVHVSEKVTLEPRDQWGPYENAAPIDHLDLAGEVRRWSGVRTADHIVPDSEQVPA